MSIPDLMVSDEIKKDLGTDILGNQIISLVETTSTNDIAIGLATKDAKEGTMVIAESQTKGRGRRRRKWLSPIGTSILASLILRPQIMPHEAYGITLISAAAVAQAIRKITALPAQIKWPNDVIVRGKKVSGVLTEMRTGNGTVKFFVVGLGVTVNISQNRLPLEIRDIATSLSIELGHHVSRIALVQEILRQLEDRYLLIKKGKVTDLIEEWKRLSATIGALVEVHLSRRIIKGQALDIDETGALVIQPKCGQIQRITPDEAIRVRAIE